MSSSEHFLLNLAREELFRSNVDYKHPFRFFTFGTVDADTGFPEIRTVVKREVTQKLEFFFYTDTRSPKVRQVQKNGNVSALFYHPKKQLQVRVKGVADVVDKESPLYKEHFKKLKQSGVLKDYTTAVSPGSPLEDNEEIGFVDKIHFSVIRIQALYLDILKLSQDGHIRALYTKRDGAWEETILVP
ncbi:pyridoxamine 5'-phosphate oxidase family protein [Limibacter armeniacum]|uniref:pyridoxamine 5'-phosphate oxidase family protein n=1 Tax=Limibacter armeniacum TaxID=466084 RepID=UPI002FE60A60